MLVYEPLRPWITNRRAPYIIGSHFQCWDSSGKESFCGGVGRLRARAVRRDWRAPVNGMTVSITLQLYIPHPISSLEQIDGHLVFGD